MIRDIQSWMPLFTITTPLVMAIFIATWIQNKHFETTKARISPLDSRAFTLESRMMALETRMGAIETSMGALETRMVALETRMDEFRNEVIAVLRDLDRRLSRLEERMGPALRG